MTRQGKTAFIGCTALVPVMRLRGAGHIVNVSSASVYKRPPNLMPYLGDGVLNREDPIAWQREMNNNARAIKRDQVPEDIAGAVRFLCSPEAALITGQALVIDGGIVFH